MTRRLALSFAVAAVTLVVSSRPALAGPIFLTGHDPDFHSQGSVGAQHLLEAGLDFATGNTEDVAGHKFLWVESRIPTPGGHLIGEHGLASLGLTLGVNYDRANADTDHPSGRKPEPEAELERVKTRRATEDGPVKYRRDLRQEKADRCADNAEGGGTGENDEEGLADGHAILRR